MMKSMNELNDFNDHQKLLLLTWNLSERNGVTNWVTWTLVQMKEIFGERDRESERVREVGELSTIQNKWNEMKFWKTHAHLWQNVYFKNLHRTFKMKMKTKSTRTMFLIQKYGVDYTEWRKIRFKCLFLNAILVERRAEESKRDGFGKIRRLKLGKHSLTLLDSFTLH